MLGRQAAVFAEPAGATGFAGLLKLLGQGRVGSGERIVVLVTGNGLKDTANAIKAVGAPFSVEPDIDAVRELVASWRL